MTPRQFVDKWRASTLGERQGAQSHFHDLCLLLGRNPPADNDLTGGGIDLTKAARLKENAGLAFQGPVLIGPSR